MFLKKIVIPDKNTGKRYTYWRLCESYRIGGKPRHRTILNLGTLEQLTTDEERKLLADLIEQLVYKRPTLFEITANPQIKKLAEYFAKIIVEKKLVDVSLPRKPLACIESDFQEVDINSIENECVREVGAEWLCAQTLQRLQLEECLTRLGWEERWIRIAMVYLIGRCVFPSSDLKTQDWLRRNSALGDIFDFEPSRLTRHHLYKVSRMLYRDKDPIEQHLARRTGQLFGTQDKILLYDLTNTYFEGRKPNSQKAQFGKSKEKRHDAKLISLALVVNADGFVKYSQFYRGNIKEHKTLEQTLRDIENTMGTQQSRRVVVMDAGIGTEENLQLLRELNYDYVSVSLSKMKDFEYVEPNKKPIELQDKRGNRLWVQWVKVADKDDHVLYVKSEGKQKKESSMEEKLCGRYEEGLLAIREGIEKKGGIKRKEKVLERIGRLKARYPSVYRYYKISLKSSKGIVKTISWEKVKDGSARHGVYFIRTTLDCSQEITLWKIYNTIREIEATFRILKTDLKMRPIFHQNDIYTQSHLFGSILAYSIVHSIRYPLRHYGICWDWSNVVRIMNSQKVVTTSMHTRTGRTIYLKRCSKPEADVSQIYRVLGYKDRPFWQKKLVVSRAEPSVLPKNEKANPKTIDIS